MKTIEIINYLIGLVGFLATAIAGFMIIRSKTVKETINQQNDLIHILNEKVAALEKSDNEKRLQIKTLRAEVDTFKNIPLKEIVDTQKQILETQQEIIKLLAR